MIAKDYKPKWTCWKHRTVRKDAIAHKRYERRAWKQYIKTGSIRDFNRANRKLTRRDFD